MARIKGAKKTGGRKKGIPNKINADLKNMLLQALHESGGIEYLKLQSELNPTAFMALLGRAMPLLVSGDIKHEGNIMINIVPVSAKIK